MVVVDLGSGLAFIRTENPSGVLQEASLARDGRGEEQGVQRWAVEPFPGVRAGRDNQQRRPARLRLEPGECGSPRFS